ncbi:oleate hydratase [Clostridium estertheticum]|uniref:oleate hydratase n=1 Tax=Clostridium estertheticum TaxID=238834 RepID=UPI0013E94DC4|nr:oleate hydratase [Clostridium estertheticum]MBZ9686868.1 oleate hydratase [Clostridium estertheticum]
MGNYQRINPLKKDGIENKRAYLIGGGIASLSAAAYMIRDGHMDGKNITIMEETHVLGGGMDGAGDAQEGYIIRGGRELEEHYECSWDLFSFIPSLKNPSRTVLDEFRELNLVEPNESNCRLIHSCGEKADFSTLGLSDLHIKQITKLFLATEEQLGATTVEQFFDPTYLETNMWYFWRSMFAFENWHSVVEMKRYMQRFMHLLPGMNQLKGILHTEYNQYDSMILPLITWLRSENVNFDLHTQINDLDISIDSKEKTVIGIHLVRNGSPEKIVVSPEDLVFVTNGSMTENSTLGSMHTPAVLNRDKVNRGCWNLWKNIASKDPSFGHPEVFCNNIDKTKWESFTMTFKGPFMGDFLKKLTGRDPGMGGVVTIKDSNWLMSWTCSKQPHFINQPDDVLVLWAYGLFPDNVGDYIKKKMCDCTGEELVSELLYHMGLKNEIPSILKNVKVIPCMMPYITSQFMPRVKGDRPDVIPSGSTNLAFLGQFAEVADDCVFTIEYSIRTAMMAVYKLLNLEKQVIPVYASKYDIRVLMAATKTLYSGRLIPGETIIKKLIKDTTLENLL